MRIVLMVGMIAMTGSAVFPTESIAACRTTDGVLVGCSMFDDDGENAVTAYGNYGSDQNQLRKDYVRAFLANHGCVVLFETAQKPIHIVRGHDHKIPTNQGWESAQLVTIDTNKGRQPFWVDQRYIVGECDPPPPPEVCILNGPCHPAGALEPKP